MKLQARRVINCLGFVFPNFSMSVVHCLGGCLLVSHPNILKVHHNDCPFQRQLRQRGAQVLALAAAKVPAFAPQRTAAAFGGAAAR